MCSYYHNLYLMIVDSSRTADIIMAAQAFKQRKNNCSIHGVQGLNIASSDRMWQWLDRLLMDVPR